MFNPEHIHIAIASDENYSRFVASLIASVIDNNRKLSRLTFHLLLNKVSESSVSKIKEVADGSNYTVDIQMYDISDLQNRLGVSVPPSIALTAYSRLFMNRIIPEDVSKILYLDTDIIIAGDLYELWNTELGDCAVAGCLDIFEGTGSKTDIGLSPDAPYVNSGVLLINLDKWRCVNMDKMFVDFLFLHNGNVRHHDQGIINAVCKDSLKLLPPQYNLHSTVFSHPFKLIKEISKPHYSQAEFKYAFEHPVIIHFTEGFYNRPWKMNCKHPYRKAYEKYRDRTAWRGTALEPDNRSFVVKSLSYTFLNMPYWCYKLMSYMVKVLSELLK